MLPATRQQWLSRLYPSRSWYSILRPCRDATLSWPGWWLHPNIVYLPKMVTYLRNNQAVSWLVLEPAMQKSQVCCILMWIVKFSFQIEPCQLSHCYNYVLYLLKYNRINALFVSITTPISRLELSCLNGASLRQCADLRRVLFVHTRKVMLAVKSSTSELLKQYPYSVIHR